MTHKNFARKRVYRTLWVPPTHLEKDLQELVSHNVQNPKQRVTIRNITRWLNSMNVPVGETSVGLWMRETMKKYGNEPTAHANEEA